MTTLESRIQSAIELVGPDRPADYLLTPSEHASRYAADAPALARLLRSSRAQAIAEQYEELDADALAVQGRFVRTTSRAHNAVFVAGLAAAGLLAAASLEPAIGAAAARVLIILSTVVGVVAGGLAAMWLHAIRSASLLEGWMRRRSQAELERIAYFDLVIREHTLSEPLLQLEYFRRYQLDVQRNFLRARGRDHAAAGERTLTLGSAAMAVAGIITALAGTLATSIAPFWASLAALALLAQAVAAHAENREATGQHRRNAERYERTRLVLDKLAGMLDEVRLATAEGRLDVMRQFVASVHDEMSLEHRQWAEEMAEASVAIGQLASLLERYRQHTDEGARERPVPTRPSEAGAAAPAARTPPSASPVVDARSARAAEGDAAARSDEAGDDEPRG